MDSIDESLTRFKISILEAIEKYILSNRDKDNKMSVLDLVDFLNKLK